MKITEETKITINKPTIIAQDATPTDEAELEKFSNVEVTVAVLHKPTGKWTAREVRRRHVRAFADSCVRNIVSQSIKIEDMIPTSEIEERIEKAKPDFTVIEINWPDKNLSITSLE